MVRGLPVFHTGDMSEDARPTAFVSEADGIFGAELISALVARGHQVFALTRSVESARILAGVPIVTAFPGVVYGKDGWLRELVMEPIVAGRRVLQFGTTGPLVSPIHIHDCVRALLHLAEHGERASRYFLVNSEPIRFNAFATTFARVAERPLRVWRLPAPTARLVSRRNIGGYIQSDAAFSNIRLRGNGFRFEYPTLEQGLRQIWESRGE